MEFGSCSLEIMVMNRQFWIGKRVFVTGHTGFKGSWLTLWLNTLEAQVCGYALAPSIQPNLFEILDLDVESYVADIRDYKKLAKTVHDFKPDIIIHMAAQPLVRYSYEYPLETYETNVMGTVNVLEVFRNSTAKIFINVTTDKVYENKERIQGYHEDEPLGGYDPYSNSKACSELVTSAYRNSFFNPQDFDRHGKAVASARAGNVIGGGDWSLDRLVPDLIMGFIKGQPVSLRYPHAIRPWQHVLEPLSGYLTLAEYLWSQPKDFSEAFNFGPTDTDCISVGALADALVKAWGQDVSWYYEGSQEVHEATFLKLDISKARVKLNWKPTWDIIQAVHETVSWYKAWIDKQNMQQFTLKQLELFKEKL